MNDYEFYEDVTVTCEKCGKNDRVYLWLDKKEQVYLISCDKCGVNEKLVGEVAQTAKNKQLLCCESFKDFLNQELYVDENPRVLEVMGKFFYYFENKSNPIVEQIKFCPFCGVILDIVGMAG
jgi:Zn ribbon nucleic-acid-binding protein